MPLPVSIREIEEADAPAIAILSEQLGYSLDAAATFTSIKHIKAHNTHFAFVAIVPGKTIGWIHGIYSVRLGSTPFCEIAGMVIDHNYRRQGVGKQLIEQVINWSKSMHATKLRVRCHSKRTETHAFYGGIGMYELKTQLVFELVIP